MHLNFNYTYVLYFQSYLIYECIEQVYNGWIDYNGYAIGYIRTGKDNHVIPIQQIFKIDPIDVFGLDHMGFKINTEPSNLGIYVLSGDRLTYENKVWSIKSYAINIAHYSAANKSIHWLYKQATNLGVTLYRKTILFGETKMIHNKTFSAINCVIPVNKIEQFYNTMETLNYLSIPHFKFMNFEIQNEKNTKLLYGRVINTIQKQSQIESYYTIDKKYTEESYTVKKYILQMMNETTKDKSIKQLLIKHIYNKTKGVEFNTFLTQFDRILHELKDKQHQTQYSTTRFIPPPFKTKQPYNTAGICWND